MQHLAMYITQINPYRTVRLSDSLRYGCGFTEKLVRQQILKDRKYRRTELLYSQRDEVHRNKLVLILHIVLFFSKLNILWKIHLLLTPDIEYSKVFENIPIIRFKKGKSLKDIPVRAKIPPVKTEEGFCGPCNKPRCEICTHVTKTHQFESTSRYEVHIFRQTQNLNCISKNVVYLFTCKTCYK